MFVAVIAYRHCATAWKKHKARHAAKILARLGLVSEPSQPYPEKPAGA